MTDFSGIIEWEYQQLVKARPEWTFTRHGTAIRAEREGYTTYKSDSAPALQTLLSKLHDDEQDENCRHQ